MKQHVNINCLLQRELPVVKSQQNRKHHKHFSYIKKKDMSVA